MILHDSSGSWPREDVLEATSSTSWVSQEQVTLWRKKRLKAGAARIRGVPSWAEPGGTDVWIDSVERAIPLCGCVHVPFVCAFYNILQYYDTYSNYNISRSFRPTASAIF